MIRKLLFIFTGIIVFGIGFDCYSQSVNIPLNHWAYDFLERLEVRGYFRNFILRARPISRQDLAHIIADIEQYRISNQIQLSAAESDLLEQLKGEFFEELTSLSINTVKHYHERHLVTWTEGDHKIKIDADFAQRFNINRNASSDTVKRRSFTSLGGIVRGAFKENFGFYINFKNTLLRGAKIEAENFNPELGMPVTISGKNVYQTEASAYLIWKLPWFQFEFGRDQAQWGPGYQGSLMLSANNPLFDMLKIQAQFKRFQFTSIHGTLASQIGQKYITAHRIDVRVFPWLFLAGSESVIYGNRDIELQYLNPIMPYHIAEQHLGNRDNNTIGFDFTLFPKRGHKFYGELFLDDFTTAENPFRYYGNKFAFLVGYHGTNPLGIANLDLKSEYTRIEPYVYTHDYPINVYKNYDQIIGHWLGPNADALFLEMSYLFNRDFKMSLLTERVRHGKGDVNTPHKPGDGIKKFFLSDIIETKWRWGISMTDQIFRDVFINLQYYYLDTRNLNLIAGKNYYETQIILQLIANW